tara:strand:+ start:1407 stop:1805 length:399 start_codon:yes stop_codon:yes gene_type:complete
MAPPACDFPEYYDRGISRVNTKREIKSHPSDVLPPVDEKHVEDAALLSPSTANAPVPEPPMEAPQCIRYVESPKCIRSPPTPPTSCCGDTPPLEDSLGLEYGLIIGIFVLGALTGSSIVYAFSKPVIVYAAN